MTEANPPTTVAAFYDRWADLYARAIRRAPGVGRMRRLAVDELTLAEGATVVDMGCGPGINFPHLRNAVGPAGRIVGVDVAPGMLARANEADPGAACVLGDASRPPLGPPLDAILATFVVTLFDEPDAVVDTWWDLLAPGGALAMVNLGPMRGLAGTLGNPLLKLGLTASTPMASRFDGELLRVLESRTTAAHRGLGECADRVTYYDSADGLFRVAVGHKPADA